MQPRNDTDTLLKTYRAMLTSRFLELTLIKLWNERKTKVVFSGFGNEHIGATLGSLLDQQDYLIPRYRGFAAQLAKGMDVDVILAELLFKKTGPYHGIGGVTPFSDLGHNVVPYNINLGSTFPIAVGLAFAQRPTDTVVAIHFGDGEATRTTFASSLNLAAVWQLPLLFVCESNTIADKMSLREMQVAAGVCEVATAYGVRAQRAATETTLEFHDALGDALAYVRSDRAPFLLEISTKRHTPHFLWSENPAQQTAPTISSPDPLIEFRDLIITTGISEAQCDTVRDESEQRVQEALAVANNTSMLTIEEFLEQINSV